MKKVLSLAAAISVAATAAFANANYPVQVVQNGITYSCSAEIVTRNGQPTRKCLRPKTGATSGGGNVFAGGLSTTGLVGLGILTLVVISAAIDDDDDSTNGTN
ncbi:MAG: hypothetical protein AB8B60_05615 [Sulfitobacter sp.]